LGQKPHGLKWIERPCALEIINSISMPIFSRQRTLRKDQAYRAYLKISSSSSKTAKKGSKGALKLEVPKMPKIEEFYRFIIKDRA
jgi:hypothetical protein